MPSRFKHAAISDVSCDTDPAGGADAPRAAPQVCVALQLYLRRGGAARDAPPCTLIGVEDALANAAGADDEGSVKHQGSSEHDALLGAPLPPPFPLLPY